LVVRRRRDGAAHAERRRERARRREAVARAERAVRGGGAQRVGELDGERARGGAVEQQRRQVHEWPSEVGRKWPCHDATSEPTMGV
jgi:hypothetical protein